MARKSPKKSPKPPPKSPPRRRSSATPHPAPVLSTPPRSIPLNFLLRALSTPPRPPSHHPFLRAFSTPLRRRSEYSPLVRRLCQQGAYDRLPYDNDAFVKQILPCASCQKTGTMTQNIVFKQGHAGEWVRVCRNIGCSLIYYPAQSGTPPDLLHRIESAREAGARSSTMATPDSRTTHSPSFFSPAPSQDLNITPSVGGEFEDWLSPLFRDLDMEAMAETRIPTSSHSGSSEPVAGPSTGPGLSSLRGPPPRCARDEEIARTLQAAIDEEDAMMLRQLEEGPPADASPSVSDRDQEPATLPSLVAELEALTGPRPAAASARTDNPALNPTSRESSPSPRPRKKKRIIVHPSPPPPRVKRKIYGPLPPAPSAKSQAKAKTSTQTAKLAKSGSTLPNAKAPSKNRVKRSAHQSNAGAVRAADMSPPVIIVISSEDERPPATRRTDGADGSDVIDITSSDSNSDTPPPATQPRTLRSRTQPHNARTPPPAAQPRTPRPRAKPRTAHSPPTPSPSRTLRSRAKLCTARILSTRTQPRTSGSRGETRGARSPRAVLIRFTEGGDDSNVISITSSESDSETPPPATQPRNTRSRAPSREVKAGTCATRRESESDSAPPRTQPRTTRPLPDITPRDVQTHTRSPSAVGNELQDSVEAGSSNKENNFPNASHSCLDFRVSRRLATSQVAAGRRGGVFASLAQTSSSSSSGAGESGDDASHISDVADPPVVETGTTTAGVCVDASEVFGNPFRFEVYPAIPELATKIDPNAEKRHWVLTVKLWYKNNIAPSTKMIPLDCARCSIRLSDVFIVARAFHSVGITNVRIWNKFTTDWEMRSLYDYLAVSITDNHTVLIRLPTVATLSSWAENISQAYGSCQTVDPRPTPSGKGKERADN